jgi:multiple sugar transport system permease protein
MKMMNIHAKHPDSMSAGTSLKRRSREHLRSYSIQTVFLYIGLTLCALLFLIPFYIVVRNALMTQLEVTSFDWHWWAKEPQWDNLNTLFSDLMAPMATGLMNSALIATLTTIGQLLFASMAGYGLARIPSRWSQPIFFLVLLTIMVPGAVTFIPKYMIVSELGWVSTLQGIIVPELFSGFACFLFRQFYLDFPHELEDAGRVDGLSYFGVYWRLLLPNSVPILVALGVISFISSWNSFLWPLVIGQDSSSWTVQVVLSTFITAQTINIPELFMGVAVAIVPLVILFFFLQRYIVAGVARSGIKG